VSTFIPALAYTFARHPTEVDVLHEERAAGESKYSMYRLIRLNFDLITGFSLVPLQIFSMAGMIVAVTSVILYIGVIVQRLVVGGFIEGVKAAWDRDILAFFLIGCIMFGVGLLGEYVGRIYHQVRERPRYLIRAVLERDQEGIEAASAAVEPVRRIG
jgi:undecaprenyl-phosphate 4-deoxy-4-formamido-L-arabinose transferase